MRWIFLSLFGVVFLGCSEPKPKDIDLYKSCEALIFQSDLIEKRLENDKKEVEEIKNRPQPLHIFIVALGATISLQPHMLESSYFYLAPALTISYHNLLGATPDLVSEYHYFEDRKIVLNRVIEEKNCHNQN